MKRGAVMVILLAGLLASCATAPDPATRDHLEIRSVKFLKASSPEFVVFVVTADYALASAAEGSVVLALDLAPGQPTPVSQHRVARGAGTVELMAESKRAGRRAQIVTVNLSEYPGGLPRRTFASQAQTVPLGSAP